MEAYFSIAVAFAAGAGVLVAWIVSKKRYVSRLLTDAQERARGVLESACAEAEQIKKTKVLEGKDELFSLRLDQERRTREARRDLSHWEQRLRQKEIFLEKKDEKLLRRERDLEALERRAAERERSTEEQERRARELLEEHKRQLQQVSGLTVEEAKKTLVRSLENEARHDAALLCKRIEEEAKESAGSEAKRIIAIAIQRCAAQHTAETTVSTVSLPSDEMKGRIIGREGRNIRALEQATGVDLIIDDTPEAVLVSAYDPVRREIARLAIQRLVQDGRIHPARIEEVVAQVSQELDQKALEEGEAAAFELGIHDLHGDLLKLLGRLKYRTSYGQNVLAHSVEVGYLAGVMAEELRVNADVARRGGLLHDVGKALTHEVEGSHLDLGVALARKCGVSEEVIHAMESHHLDVDFHSVEAMLVQAADAISASRPGARRDVLESYVRRLEKLEAIADSFVGVSKAYAVQAGRELRILVESDKLSDEDVFWLTKDITKKIQNEVHYPGQIKVTVIRETRVVDYAK
ncbi:MAG: ribonuclease Y [Acidobacteria bacterium]|nr:ribonuclease Y [Acidobacteriota bacterium]